MKIESIDAYQIFDSRGQPTVEVRLILDDGSCGCGMVPSGASTGQFEALELRDNDRALFRGKSVYQAVANVREEIASALRNESFSSQKELDERLCHLDGTDEKSRLGANAILGVSMAFAEAMAKYQELPLYQSLGPGRAIPLPEVQIIGGGAHAEWRTDVQDFLVIPTGARSFEEAMEIVYNVYHVAGELLARDGKRLGCADEGGYWPEFESNEEILRFLVRTIEAAGYEPGRDVALSLDIAASDLFDPATNRYRFAMEQRDFSSEAFMDLLISWCRDYPVASIEDPAADTDWSGWERFHAACGTSVQIIGDDLFTTRVARIREGIRRGVANSVLIKLNQIGTVTETLRAIAATKEARWSPVVSARSGETESPFISHLAVASEAGQLKVGSFSRSERMVKWNECLRIARQLGAHAQFAGADALAGWSAAQIESAPSLSGESPAIEKDGWPSH